MRLPKHKLPKENHKHLQTVKHKKSAKKLQRLELKEAKKLSQSTVEMKVDGAEEGEALVLSAEEKERLRLERKKANAHKNFYKKQNLAVSGKNGPRAVNRGCNI